MKNHETGCKRLIEAFKYSMSGLNFIFKREEAFRIEIFISIICIFIILFVNKTLNEKLFLMISTFLVIFSEIINTAIEVVIDRISEEYNYLSKIAKDIGSLLVLSSIVFFIIIWGSIFLWCA